MTSLYSYFHFQFLLLLIKHEKYFDDESILWHNNSGHTSQDNKLQLILITI
jgi:hypothetical protein